MKRIRSGFAGACAGVSAMAIAVALTLAVRPALADGGAGQGGAAGGSGYAGAAGNFDPTRGGGGGAAGGGRGGDGLLGGTGGAGGTFASHNGANGQPNNNTFGGGGGGGGWNGNDPNGQPGGTGTASIALGAGNSLAGGNGGNGGGSSSCGGCGGGGGGGGYGAIVTGGGASSNAGTISGGNGGNGAAGAGGGDGGFGVQFTGTAAGASFTNSGSVSGGNGGNGQSSGSGNGTGGAGGTAVAFAAAGGIVNSGTITGGNGSNNSLGGTNGAGGAGITGAGLSVTNSGTITGGLGGDGVTRANAITFTSGANTLTLQAGSTITGNVVVNTGGGATGTLVLGGGTGATFNNSLIGSQYSGFTTFQKSGTSTWSLTGSDAQAWTVSGGTLQVGDSAHGSATIGSADVGAGGTLSGHGTVTGNVTNTSGGIVSPGGSIGTLTVGGNYTQGAGSTLAIEVSPTAASKLAVTGNANLAGTLALTYTPGVYSARSYTIVEAANVAGTFGTVAGTAPTGFGQSLSYGPTTVTLTLSGFTVSPTVTDVVGQVGTAALLGAQNANSLLMSHLGGGVWGEGLATSASASAFVPIQLAFAGNAGDLAALLTQAPRAVASSGGWVRGYGAHSSVDGSNATGYRTNDDGFLAGYDRELNRDVKVGLAFGYGHSELHSKDNGRAKLDSPRVMAYGSWQLGPWAMDATVGYAFDTVDTTRPLPTGTAAASHRAHEFTAEAQIRTGLDIGEVAVVPAAGLRYARVIEQGYTENGAGGNNLKVDGRTLDSAQPFVGISAARAFDLDGDMVWTPRAELEYAYELNSNPGTTVSVGGGTFTAAGTVPSRDRLTVGLGLSGKLRDKLLFDISYRTLHNENYHQHAVSAGLRYRF